MKIFQHLGHVLLQLGFMPMGNILRILTLKLRFDALRSIMRMLWCDMALNFGVMCCS